MCEEPKWTQNCLRNPKAQGRADLLKVRELGTLLQSKHFIQKAISVLNVEQAPLNLKESYLLLLFLLTKIKLFSICNISSF